MGSMNIAVFGDVVGEAGVEFFARRLNAFRKQYAPDMIIVNGENSAKGNGIDPVSAEALRLAGADVITGGNHTFKKKQIREFLDDNSYLIRPANYPAGTPGSGWVTVPTPLGRVLVMNVLGCVFMDALRSPFETVSEILDKNAGQFDIAVLDVHAEATSEKAALARYFDGKISVVFGTHTHVQTSDARVLPGGTGFVTDIGMCGPVDSILGVKPEGVIEKFVTKLPVYLEQAEGKCALEGAVFSVGDDGRCLSAETFRIEE